MSKINEPMGEIREIRHQISKEFEHNPKKYIDYLKKIKTDYLAQTNLYENLLNNQVDKASVGRVKR